MKILVYVTILFLPFLSKGQTKTSIIDTSHYFEFHSDYWINLHHFLYQKADSGQLKNLLEDGLTFLDIGEDSVYDKLTDTESENLNEAVEYYKTHLTDKSLFRLGELRVWLQNQDPQRMIDDTTFSKPLTDMLNIASTVYRPHFWPLHNTQNRKILDSHKETILRLEEDVIDELERLSGDTWPKTKVRVDLTAYANWAGAYTPTRPKINIFISTLAPSSTNSHFIETLFHEGTHLLFTRKSPFRAKIYFMSADLDIQFPNNLWHACQFYLAGRVVQDHLRQSGIDHKLSMNVKNIFSNYNTQEFRSILEKYYQGKVDIDTTIKSLLRNLK